MLISSLALGLLGLVSSSLARPANGVELLEKLSTVPRGWTQGEAPPASHLMKFRIAVKQKRAGEFERMVVDMSTPGHATYGKHMTKREMKDFLRPSADVTDAILSWLRSEDIPEDNIEDNGDWITFIVPISHAERMLDTEFYHYHHAETDVTRVRTLQYSIPIDLHEHITMIQPTIRFGTFKPQRSQVLDKQIAPEVSSAEPAASCNNRITPTCLRSLYGLDDYDIPYTADISTPLGVSGYLEELARYDDLDRFIRSYDSTLDSTFTVVSINDGTTDQDSTDDSVEANLDIQYALAMAPNLTAVYYSTGGRGELVPDLDQPTQDDNYNEPYLELLNYLIDLEDDELPKVLTTSYGEDEQSVPESYANSTCNLFSQLGSRGVSVIFSSGDTGVGSACQTNDGTETTRFLPIFPASCPYVTSVGGTYHIDPEEAIYFSSGGFSDLWPRPSYQDEAVSAYLEVLGDQWDGLYNPEGRGFPDVAAQSYNYYVYDQGTLYAVGGTSASAPTWAGIVASLNEVRGSPLGFLNPWIYSSAYQGLTDIVDGGSTGCDGEDDYSGLETPYVPYASWNATTGWDPVTGYGTPNFPALVALLE